MISFCAAYLACVLPALPTERPDTPPPLPIPLSRLDSLKTEQDIVAASVLANGQRAPMNLVLPELRNRDEVLSFMVASYPPVMRDSLPGDRAIAWAFISRQGTVDEFKFVRSNGRPLLDSLAARTLRMMRFAPARVGNDTVGVWAPYPVRIASYTSLANALEDRFKPRPPRDPGEPYFTPYTVQPVVQNREEIAHALVQLYPKELREARTGGTTIVWLFVTREGKVAKALVRTSSGHPRLDSAAVEVAYTMQFSPARNRDQPVDVWIQIPIKFSAQ